jgi:hypothetical protein
MGNTMAKRKIDWNVVTSKIQESEKKVSYQNEDGYSEKLYTPKLNDDGSFQAVIRFLPRPEGDGDGVPFVKLMNHGFQDVGGWFIENCPTSIGEKCPVCENNSKDWKSGNQEQSSIRGRRTSFFSNILVITDPQTPENEGKVFIWRYGKKIQDKILEKITPAAGSIDEPVQIFDYEQGQNFKLKIKKIKTNIRGKEKTHNNYDSSAFTGTSTEVDNWEKVDGMLHKLGDIISKDKFKSYDTLLTKFQEKTGESVKAQIQEKPKKKDPDSVSSGFTSETSDDDDDMEFLKRIRNE